MITFAKRLKHIIEEKGLSQAQAAKLCGISQQSINYIIVNNLESSKLAPQLATNLGINTEWLIYGTGKPYLTPIHEVPIIHSVYMLKKFMSKEPNINTLDYTVTDRYLGNNAFAYLFKSKELLICTSELLKIKGSEFLSLIDDQVLITAHPAEVSFLIFEWRKRYEDF